jgi:hypothetical protein
MKIDVEFPDVETYPMKLEAISKRFSFTSDSVSLIYECSNNDSKVYAQADDFETTASID